MNKWALDSLDGGSILIAICNRYKIGANLFYKKSKIKSWKKIRLWANLLSFKRAITPAASAGDGCPQDEDWGWSGALWCGLALEEVGVDGREDEPTTEGGYQDCVGISWKFGSVCCCWELQYVHWAEPKAVSKGREKNQNCLRHIISFMLSLIIQ